MANPRDDQKTPNDPQHDPLREKQRELQRQGGQADSGRSSPGQGRQPQDRKDPGQRIGPPQDRPHDEPGRRGGRDDQQRDSGC